MGRLYRIFETASQGHITPLAPLHLLTSLFTDIPVLLAVQGDPAQVGRRETFGAMPKSRASHWGASESSRRVCPRLVCSGGKHRILVRLRASLTDSHQTERLKHDLSLWSAGLFPFFEYAATSVKVCDTHIHTSGLSQCSSVC